MTEIPLCLVENYLPIEKLKLHPNNPRTIKPDRLQALKDSIISKGFYQPILVWRKGHVILAGNHRFMAVQELIKEGFTFNSPDGAKHVLPVVIEDVEAEVAEAILFETNNTYAEWVEEKLRLAIKDAEDRGVNPSEYGFTSDQVDNLLHNALEDADAITPPPGSLGTSLDPTDEAGVMEAIGDEEFESLILPKPVYETMTGLLADIAKTINPEWTEGDDYGVAAQMLCDFMRDPEIEAQWRPSPSSTKTTSKKKSKTH